MREKINKAKISGARVKMLHGHTKIELTAIATGEKRIIEHDNTFQATVIEDYMRSMGAFNNSPFANQTWREREPWRNLVGGIFLFDEAIQESSKYAPREIGMTGNGAYGVSNADAPTELGSYNSVESTVGDRSITIVYDWGTSQGNGTIASICLTSEAGGYIGYGNKSGNATSTKRSPAVNQSSVSMEGIPYGDSLYRFAVDEATHVIKVRKTPKAIENVSLFTATKEFDVSYSGLTYAEGGSEKLVAYMGGSKVAILPLQAAATWNAGATFNFIIYDMATDSVSQGAIINETGHALPSFRWYYGGDNKMIGFTGGRYVIWADDRDNTKYKGPMHVFDTTDGSLVASIGDSSYTKEQYTNKGAIKPWTDGRFMVDADIFDIDAETWAPTNMPNDSAGYGYLSGIDAIREYSNLNGISTNSTYAPSGSEPIAKNPLYLATINNLETPVTKDNTQTMKVTYTLTEVTE